MSSAVWRYFAPRFAGSVLAGELYSCLSALMHGGSPAMSDVARIGASLFVLWAYPHVWPAEQKTETQGRRGA